jgi:glucokinase
MQELSYKERLAIAYLKKRLKGALSNPLYKLAIAKLIRTNKINFTNLSFTFKVPGLIIKGLTLKTWIIPKATLNTTRSKDKYI